MKEHGGFTGVELANIAAMQMKLKEYEAIGTPEEFQALKDRLIAKKVSLRHVRKFDGIERCAGLYKYLSSASSSSTQR